MARAEYIWVVVRAYAGTIISAFTVKHELEAFLARHGQPDYEVQRVRDGGTTAGLRDAVANA
jgi:hypothetical protein